MACALASLFSTRERTELSLRNTSHGNKSVSITAVNGTRASATMIGDDETNWGTKSLAILDMPFTAVMDTLLLPWDVFRKDSSVRSRVEKSEANAQATNAVIPPARMPDN